MIHAFHEFQSLFHIDGDWQLQNSGQHHRKLVLVIIDFPSMMPVQQLTCLPDIAPKQ